MNRILTASLLGAIIVFFYDFASWSLLSWHTPQSFTSNDEVAEVIQKNAPVHGIYMIPAPTQTGETDAKAITNGPFIYATVRPNKLTSSWSMLKPMALSFLLNLLLAWIIAIVMHKRSTYQSRVLVGIVFGIFAGLSASLPNAIWLELPALETIARLVDPIASWLLAALAMAAVIKSPERKIFIR